jgi:exonuclease SbcD
VREPTRAGLADDVRALFPRAVDVRVEVDVPASLGHERTSRRGRSPHELFAEYLTTEGIDDPRVVRLFDRLYDDAVAEAQV